MKKVFLGLLAALMLTVPAFAHPLITVYVDGEQLSFDQPPIIQDDRTLVPMRKIFEALDAQVIWDEADQTVMAMHNEDIIMLQIGEAGLYKNGELVYTMSVPAQIINDRTLVPLRAVAESLGASVAWDGVKYVIDIHSDGTSEKPAGSEQQAPQVGGYTSSVLAADGTEVLHVELKCDEVAGQAAVNTAMAQATFNEGKAFLQTYKAQALQAYANDPNGFQPYYCMGAYNVTRSTNGYASFLGTVSSSAGGTEQAQYTSHTYAMSSGRECALSELVSDSQADLQALWKASFTVLIEADEDAFYSDAESRLARSLNQVQFYLTDSGIVFYLSPGIIAPAATGAVSFEIAYQI